MGEDFLQFIWEQRLFDRENQATTAGEKLEIIHTGTRNTDSGPDFFNAKIKIGDTLWAGNVEIHVNASDWYKHQHHIDAAYDNIILHVVVNGDKPAIRAGGETIPTLIMSYPQHLFENYSRLLASQTWIPCESDFHKIDPFVLKIGFNRLLIDRLEDKTCDIIDNLALNRQNWNETFYRFLAQNFGFKTNALPFKLLAQSLPVGILGKHKNNLQQIESLLFGQAGLLHDEIDDDYYRQLRTEYAFLSKKYALSPMSGHLWKFMRLRPVNFPTIRIAQFAALINKSSNLLSKILDSKNLDSVIKSFDVKASEYWESHYKFGSETSAKGPRRLGESAIYNIIINTVVPFMFVYGNYNSKNHLKDNALEWLDNIPPESNSIISGWKRLGVEPRSAFDTQALIQLKNRYCTLRKCLQCHVGNKLIRNAYSNNSIS